MPSRALSSVMSLPVTPLVIAILRRFTAELAFMKASTSSFLLPLVKVVR